MPREITEAEVRRLSAADMTDLGLDLWERNALLAWQGVGSGAARPTVSSCSFRRVEQKVPFCCTDDSNMHSKENVVGVVCSCLL